jgi:hypothetical protein
MAAAFVMAALLLHRGGRWIAAAAAFGLALLSKESALCFPLLVVLTDWLAPRTARRWAPITAYVLLLLPYAWLRHATTDYFTAGVIAVVRLVHGQVQAALWSTLEQVAGTARLLLSPLPLSGWIAVPAVGLLFAATLRLAPAAHRRQVWAAGGWVTVACLPHLPLAWMDGRYVYLPSVGWVMLLIHLGLSAWTNAASRVVPRALCAAAMVAWIVVNVVGLQSKNERFRRNGVMSARIIEAVAAAVPRPQPGTLFVVDGMAPFLGGAVASIRQPVMLFGLGEALRIRFAQPRLDVVYPEMTPVLPSSHDRPVIRLRWNEQTESFAQQ